jgi:hypothetical protein
MAGWASGGVQTILFVDETVIRMRDEGPIEETFWLAHRKLRRSILFLQARHVATNDRSVRGARTETDELMHLSLCADGELRNLITRTIVIATAEVCAKACIGLIRDDLQLAMPGFPRHEAGRVPTTLRDAIVLCTSLGADDELLFKLYSADRVVRTLTNQVTARRVLRMTNMTPFGVSVEAITSFLTVPGRVAAPPDEILFAEHGTVYAFYEDSVTAREAKQFFDGCSVMTEVAPWVASDREGPGHLLVVVPGMESVLYNTTLLKVVHIEHLCAGDLLEEAKKRTVGWIQTTLKGSGLDIATARTTIYGILYVPKVGEHDTPETVAQWRENMNTVNWRGTE